MAFDQSLASSEDSPELMSLMRMFYREEGYPFNEERTRRALLALLSNPLFGKVWVFRMEGRAVGYLVVTFGYSLEFGGRDAFIDELFVEPAARGQGVGTFALETAQEHCRRNGVAALHLEVEHENPKARALYERIGFKAHSRFLMTRWL
jgi:diamine N-acetyltransferase